MLVVNTAAPASTDAASASARHSRSNNKDNNKLHAVVVVLGDLGRSPRMQYHALSLLQEGHDVSLVGYTGEDLIPDLRAYETSTLEQEQEEQQQQSTTTATTGSAAAANMDTSQRSSVAPAVLHVVRFTPPTPTAACGKLVYFLLRLLALALWTTWALIARVNAQKPVDVILVQNPPALPLLLVAYCFTWYARIIRRQAHRPCLVIDWHNLGYSMLASGLLQRVARQYERTMAPLADAHWTVTTAMRQYLETDLLAHAKHGLLIQEVPDCPPSMFTTRSVADQHDVLQKLGPALEAACPRAWKTNWNRKTQTVMTEVVVQTSDKAQQQSPIRHRRGRPALVTSSTSWTPDEDFGILLQALLLLDDQIQAAASSLQVLVVVTGKGPQKTMYERKISQLALRHVAVTTVWLEPADYPRLLAAADLGVSLHTSTSGLDLPMKVLDLFGCQVPVCAMQFACLDELVQDGVNGRVFGDSAQLAQQLWELLSPLSAETAGVPNHGFGELQRFAQNLQSRPRWHENWLQQAWPVVQQVVQERSGKNSCTATTPTAPVLSP